MTMQIIQRNPTDLKGYERNARTHSTTQVEQIAASIREFGFNNPILIDEADTIIAGHGRLAAALKLEMYTVPCIVLAHLTEAQRRAYILADNKIALGAGWSEQLLSLEISELMELDMDMSLTGFSEKEIDKLLDTGLGDVPAASDDGADTSLVTVTCPKCGFSHVVG